jgi:hypothetical protein
MLQRLGKRVTGEPASNVDRVAVAAEPIADMAGIGMELMEHHHDRLLLRSLGSGKINPMPV